MDALRVLNEIDNWTHMARLAHGGWTTVSPETLKNLEPPKFCRSCGAPLAWRPQEAGSREEYDEQTGQRLEYEILACKNDTRQWTWKKPWILFRWIPCSRSFLSRRRPERR